MFGGETFLVTQFYDSLKINLKALLFSLCCLTFFLIISRCGFPALFCAEQVSFFLKKNYWTYCNALGLSLWVSVTFENYGRWKSA